MSILWNSGTSTRGNPKIGGAYDLQTQEGFPVDMLFEMAKEKSHDIDWMESFLSALERHPNEYETLVKQAKLLDPEYAEECERGFKLGCATFGYSLEKFRQYQQEKKASLNAPPPDEVKMWRSLLEDVSKPLYSFNHEP